MLPRKKYSIPDNVQQKILFRMPSSKNILCLTMSSKKYFAGCCLAMPDNVQQKILRQMPSSKNILCRTMSSKKYFAGCCLVMPDNVQQKILRRIPSSKNILCQTMSSKIRKYFAGCRLAKIFYAGRCPAKNTLPDAV